MILQYADRIRYLRDKVGMTQSDLARRLGISRSAVNSWEMSLSAPSLSNLVEMSQIFHVSLDSLIFNSEKITITLSDLTPDEQEIIFKLVDCFRSKRESK